MCLELIPEAVVEERELWTLAVNRNQDWRGQVFEDPHWGSAFGHEQRVLERDALAELAAQIRGALQPVA